jgi:hypothetical protein
MLRIVEIMFCSYIGRVYHQSSNLGIPSLPCNALSSLLTLSRCALSCLPALPSCSFYKSTNCVRCSTSDVPNTPCGLSDSLSCTIDSLPNSSSHTAKKSALSLCLVTAGEGVVNRVGKVS